VLEVLVAEGGDPAEIIQRLDLAQVGDDAALAPLVHAVMEANPDKVSAYRSGKVGLFGFFMGQAMRESGGKADPARLQALLEVALGGPSSPA